MPINRCLTPRQPDEKWWSMPFAIEDANRWVDNERISFRMSVLRRLPILLIALAALCSPLTALGQTPPGRAQQLFEQGRDAFTANDYDAARVYFEQSQAIDPRVGTLLN